MSGIEKEVVILKKTDFKPSTKGYRVVGAFNPGVLKLKNGDYLIYVRIAEKPKIWRKDGYYYSPRFVGNKEFKLKLDRFSKKEIAHLNGSSGFNLHDGTARLTTISHLRRVYVDKDGFTIKKIEQEPAFYGTAKYGELGIEDPRITKIKGRYIMTYVSLSKFNSISTACAISETGRKWHREGIIFRHQNKDVVLFPEKIKGKYVAFHRPEGNLDFSLPHMWISYSKDLEYWGEDKSVLISERAWDSSRVGAGAPPIKIKQGWLEFYHGVKFNEKDEKLYCAGIALFDLNKPNKLLARSPQPFLVPHLKKETNGFMKNVLFPTAAFLDKDSIFLYSGGADEVVIFRKINLKFVLDHLKKC
jgi:beta-1,2-mannobiose phosphorylase / 1,2-beta-oligomannan phosphorylase